METWRPTTQEVVTKTVNLPAQREAVANPFDPTLLDNLTTASGKADADRARQVAAANLAMLTGNPTSAQTQIKCAAFKGASIADEIKSRRAQCHPSRAVSERVSQAVRRRGGIGQHSIR